MGWVKDKGSSSVQSFKKGGPVSDSKSSNRGKKLLKKMMLLDKMPTYEQRKTVEKYKRYKKSKEKKPTWDKSAKDIHGIAKSFKKTIDRKKGERIEEREGRGRMTVDRATVTTKQPKGAKRPFKPKRNKKK